MTIRIVLANQKGIVLVDDKDADLAAGNWCLSNGYPSRRKNKRLEYLHRLIAESMAGRPIERGEVVDHINHDVLDNRRANLRLVSQSVNMMNRAGAQVNGTSGYRGVTYQPRSKKNPWMAQIAFRGQRKFLGLHPTKEAAAKAFRDALSRIEETGGL